MRTSSEAALDRLLSVCDHLLGENGCPWDREQTLDSITPYLQEETWEVLDAIARRDPTALREEMGDLFYLLVFAAALARRGGLPLDVADVLNGVSDKLIRRHPHVFGDAHERDAEGAIRQWEEIKKAESGANTTLGKRPPGLPALTTAYRIQEKAAAVRFEWTDVRGALAKLREEIDELEALLGEESAPQDGAAGESGSGIQGPRASAESKSAESKSAESKSAESKSAESKSAAFAGAHLERRRDEVGDILYSAVNVARYIEVDPELALRGTIAKFMARFRFIEEQLEARGRRPAESSLEEMDALWNEAKRRGIR